MTGYRLPVGDTTSGPPVEARRARAREVATELEATAQAMDATNIFSWEAYRALGAAGLLATVPRPGEAAAGALVYVITCEELGRVSAALANLVQLTTVAAAFLERYAAPPGNQALVADLAAGRALCAVAMTEAEAGSDVAGIMTTAVPQDGGYVLTGEKRFVTGAAVASHAIVTAKVPGGEAPGKVSTFLVDFRAPGVTIASPDDLLGSRGLGTSTVAFHDVRLDAGALIGQEGKGLRQILSVIDVGRLGVAGLALGLATRAVELAIARAAERRQFGVPIASHQGIQFRLADMYAQSAGARAALYAAAHLCDAGRPFALEAAVAKLLTSEAAVCCAQEAVQIYGGDGYRRGSVVERLYRDAKGSQIYEGTNEIQRVVIARALLRPYQLNQPKPDPPSVR